MSIKTAANKPLKIQDSKIEGAEGGYAKYKRSHQAEFVLVDETTPQFPFIFHYLLTFPFLLELFM
ncbi:hypothetical protein ACTXT7_010583 [Hymenolepis weldensis]